MTRPSCVRAPNTSAAATCHGCQTVNFTRHGNAASNAPSYVPRFRARKGQTSTTPSIGFSIQFVSSQRFAEVSGALGARGCCAPSSTKGLGRRLRSPGWPPEAKEAKREYSMVYSDSRLPFSGRTPQMVVFLQVSL